MLVIDYLVKKGRGMLGMKKLGLGGLVVDKMFLFLSRDLSRGRRRKMT